MDAKSLGDSPVNAFQSLGQGGLPNADACAGITLRQQFAAMAMQGMLSNNLECDGITLDEVTKETAESAVAYADALLAALTKPAGGES